MKSIRLWTVTISSLTSDRQDQLAATLRCKIITINFNCSVLKFQQLLLSSVPTPHHTSCFSVCTPYLKPFDSSLCATSPGFSYHLGGQVWGLFPVSLFQLLPVLFWRIPPDFNLYVVFVHSLYFNDVSWPVCDWLWSFLLGFLYVVFWTQVLFFRSILSACKHPTPLTVIY